LIKDGKYRYTLQFGMNTAEERQAGQFLEQLGNRKSPIIVAALNKYLEDNPELLDSQVCVRVHVSNLRQHRTIASASLSRLFAPLPQFRKWETYSIPPFSEL